MLNKSQNFNPILINLVVLLFFFFNEKSIFLNFNEIDCDVWVENIRMDKTTSYGDIKIQRCIIIIKFFLCFPFSFYIFSSPFMLILSVGIEKNIGRKRLILFGITETKRKNVLFISIKECFEYHKKISYHFEYYRKMLFCVLLKKSHFKYYWKISLCI